MAKISVSDTAIATSGDYEKFFMYQGKRYHHIFNPRDGLPADGCQSVTIVCKEGITADALATAVFVLGPEKGYSLCQKLEGVDCLIVDKEGKDTTSPMLKKRITFSVVNPIVALSSALAFIKPLPIEERPLSQSHLLDQSIGDL
jgi:thiamine biosynthesis lipoprotein